MRLWVTEGADHIELCEQTGFEPTAQGGGALSWQQRLDLQDRWQADAFVQRHFRHGSQMHELRAMLARQSPLVHRLSDEQVLHQVANELCFGSLRADRYHPCAQPVLRVNADSSATVVAPLERPAPTPAQPSTAAPEPVAAAAPAAVETVATATQPTQEQVAAQETLATMLEQAAQDATPFCEACELARTQRAAAPLPAVTPEVKAAQETQAAMLEQAAESAVPFCEVCELARKQAAAGPEGTAQQRTEAVQAAQAAVLEQAAQTGTSFCEICERNA